MAVKLQASDEEALHKLNVHAQQAAGDIHNDIDWAYEGTKKISELPSMEDYAKKVRIETGNERVDANSKEWLDDAIKDAKVNHREVEPAEDMANNFVDLVNQAYTKDMSWYQGKDQEEGNLFGNGLDDLGKSNNIQK